MRYCHARPPAAARLPAEPPRPPGGRPAPRHLRFRRPLAPMLPLRCAAAHLARSADLRAATRSRCGGSAHARLRHRLPGLRGLQPRGNVRTGLENGGPLRLTQSPCRRVATSRVAQTRPCWRQRAQTQEWARDPRGGALGGARLPRAGDRAHRLEAAGSPGARAAAGVVGPRGWPPESVGIFVPGGRWSGRRHLEGGCVGRSRNWIVSMRESRASLGQRPLLRVGNVFVCFF